MGVYDIDVVVSWMYNYLQTHKDAYIEDVELFYVNFNSMKNEEAF